MRDQRREELLRQFQAAAPKAPEGAPAVVVPEVEFTPLHKPLGPSEQVVVAAPYVEDEEIVRMGVALENILDKAKERNEQEIAVLARTGLGIAIDGSEDDVG